MGWQPAADGDADVESTWPYSDDPTSSYFQAAMHMNPRFEREPITPELAQRWNHCTHGPGTSPDFFLAWHRAYVYWFEVIVRAEVAALGGPEDWTLRGLPWAFCQERLPDGEPNPLFIADPLKRGLQPTDARGQPMYVRSTSPYYDDAYRERGLRRVADDRPGFDAVIDNQPHGVIHVDVGSGARTHPPGWMRSTRTASFDPIFWVHHAQMDRLWVGWNRAGNPNPDDADWLEATSDTRRETRWNFWRDADLANVFQVYPGQLVDPERLEEPFPYSYRYADLPDPEAPPSPGAQLRAAARARRQAAPEVQALAPQIGSSAAPVTLGGESASSVVMLTEPGAFEQVVGAEPLEPARIVLQLDGVVAEGAADNFEVYLNHPGATRDLMGEHPNFVGTSMATGTAGITAPPASKCASTSPTSSRTSGRSGSGIRARRRSPSSPRRRRTSRRTSRPRPSVWPRSRS